MFLILNFHVLNFWNFAKTNILGENLFGNRGGVQAQMPTALKTMHFILKRVMGQFIKDSFSSQFKTYFEVLFAALKQSYQMPVCVSPITVHFWLVYSLHWSPKLR